MSKKRQKVLLAWSGGKNSSISLFELKSPDYSIEGIVSFVRESDKKLLNHDYDETLVDAQAKSLEMNLYKIYIPSDDQEAFETSFHLKMKELKSSFGIEALAFGDVYTSEARLYREKLLKKNGMEAIFPIWGWKAEFVNQAFFGMSHQAIVYAIAKKLPPAFLGRNLNQSFVDDLPPSANPAGLNGEFQAFVYEGPFFQWKVPFRMGDERKQIGNMLVLDLELNEELVAGHNRVN